MNALLISAVVVFMTGQGMFGKNYTIKNGGRGVFVYSCISCLAAAIMFVVTSGGKLNFTPEFMVYSLGFAIAYSSCGIFNLMAVKIGSLALTSLVTSYSLIIPTLCGIILYNDPVSKFLVTGLILLGISIAFVNFPSKNDGALKISFRWALYALVAFVANGSCSTVQQIQQKTFDGGYGKEFMIAALLMSALVAGIAALLCERKDIKDSVKNGGMYALCSGGLNAFVNLFVMILVMNMNASVFFPLISVGGIVCTVIVSTFIYKERLSFMQIIGFIFGLGAIVFLNM